MLYKLNQSVIELIITLYIPCLLITSYIYLAGDVGLQRTNSALSVSKLTFVRDSFDYSVVHLQPVT